LSQILRRTDVRQVDFLSLDVEGFELDVLQSLDWRVPVHVMLIERHPRGTVMEQLLLSKGFKYVREVAGSHVFVNSTWQRGAGH